MKVLIHSNAPFTPTAYGQQTALIAPRIAALGHDVAISCMTGVMGRPMEWEGLPLLPMGVVSYSVDMLPKHARHFFGSDPGLVLIHYDPWAIGVEPVRGLATACWAPVHCDPMPEASRQFFTLSGAVPIATARYGEQKMAEAGLQPVYCPHGIDLDVFKPLEPAGIARAREMLNVPEGAFMVAIVGANKGNDPPRKGWGEQLAAFAAFRAKHAEAVLFIHSPAAEPFGIDMRPLIANLGIADSVIFSDDYAQAAGMYTPAFVAAVMGAADVVAMATWGEGFGIPIIEAQACGTPVIISDSTAMPELLGAGWKVPTQPYWHPGDRAWWHAPSIRHITLAMERAHRNSAHGPTAAKMRNRARAFAAGYDVELTFNTHWKPALEMLEQYAGAGRVKLPGRNGGPSLPTAEHDGLRWLSRGSHTDDWIADQHEAPLAPLFDSLLPEGGVFVDVGAHVGRWALRLAGKASKVIAVEANADTAAVLRYHLALNAIDNVTVLEIAAWDEPATLELSSEWQWTSTCGSTRVAEAGELAGVFGTVEALPLDAVLEDEDRIDLVKLDVEGADLQALWGMGETLARLHPVLLIEDHSIYGYYARSQLEDVLARLGYSCTPVTAVLAGGAEAPYVVARFAGEIAP